MPFRSGLSLIRHPHSSTARHTNGSVTLPCLRFLAFPAEDRRAEGLAAVAAEAPPSASGSAPEPSLFSLGARAEEQEAGLRMGCEGFDGLSMVKQQEILVLGDQQETLKLGQFPDRQIISSTEPEKPHMPGIWKLFRKQRWQEL